MEFWIFFIFICAGFVVLESIVPAKERKIVPKMLLILIVFITSFRYQIGGDYDNYVSLFEQAEIGNLYPEITFQIIAVFLKNIGCTFQTVFLVYSVLTVIILWYALSFYTNKTDEIILFVVLFVLIRGMYWDLMINYIRQGLAASIFFYATRFIILKNFYKYLLMIIVCSMIHLSSIILLTCYFIPKIKLIRLNFMLWIFLAILFSWVSPNAIERVLEYFGIYQSTLAFSDVRGTLAINTSVAMISLLFWNNKDADNIQIFIFKMYALSIITGIAFSFSNSIYRVSLYLQLFQGLFFIVLANNFKGNSKKFFKGFAIIFFAIIFFAYINISNQSYMKFGQTQTSSYNINYKFNFILF